MLETGIFAKAKIPYLRNLGSLMQKNGKIARQVFYDNFRESCKIVTLPQAAVKNPFMKSSLPNHLFMVALIAIKQIICPTASGSGHYNHVLYAIL